MQQELTDLVQGAFPGASVQVLVDGNRAEISVVSDVFADMSRVKKQQAVYACIDEYISDGRLHAVSIKAQAPEG